jgi:hypothetical protein
MNGAELDPDRIQWQASGTFEICLQRISLKLFFMSKLCTVQTVSGARGSVVG